jgi:hypothetical protein
MLYRPVSLHVRQLKIGMLVLLGVIPCACRRIELEREPVEPATAKPAELTPSPDTPLAPPSAPESPKAPEQPAYPRPGWSELALRDKMPICVFSSMQEREKAPFIADVKRPTLRANSKVVFGVYGPWCINAACDERPTLQCWTDGEGDTLVVHTRYSSYHKDGSSCSDDCLGLDAMCETAELKPGKYTIRHGNKTYKLQIPSVVRDPCLKPPT